METAQLGAVFTKRFVETRRLFGFFDAFEAVFGRVRLRLISNHLHALFVRLGKLFCFHLLTLLYQVLYQARLLVNHFLQFRGALPSRIQFGLKLFIHIALII